MVKFVLLILVLGVAFTACHTKKNKTASKGEVRDVLSIALPLEIQKLDWNMSTDLSSRIIETNLMEGLTSIEVRGSNVDVIPALAESWDRNAGGLEYIFHLKDGVLWSDSKRLVAQQFVDSFQRLLGSTSPWAESLFIVRGARQFHEGKVKNFKEVGIEAVNDHTLKFSLNEPVPYFLALFSHHSTFPIRKDLIEENKNWSQPDKLVTLGAYTVESYDPPSRLQLKRNDRYPLKRPLLKTLDFHLGLSSSDALEMFKNSEVGAVVDFPSHEVREVSNRDEVFFTPLLDVTYLTFNIREKPIDNPIFRRAIAMSIDRDELVHALGDSVKAIGGMVPPGLVGYESNRGVRFDPDAAKELLHHSGYGNLEKYDPIYLRVNLNTESKAAASNVQAQLKRALNVDVKVALSDSDLPKDARTVFLSHWAASVPDPDNFLALFTSMSLNNPTGWKNRNYDEFVRQAATTLAVEAREKLYAKAQHILTETEMPVVPLFLNTQFCLVNNKIRNFPLNPLGFMPFKGVSVESK